MTAPRPVANAPRLADGDPLSVPSEVKARLSVLVIDDDRTLREGCTSILQIEGFNVSSVGRGDEALELVRRRKFDIVLLDLYITPVSGMEILKAALAVHKDTLIVVMTGNPSVTSSIEALRAGAWDYLPKPFSASHLQVLLGRASHAVMVSHESKQARLEMSRQNGHGESLALLGQAPSFRQAVDLARRVAATDASVMITGESGTGKELFAQFIHQNSRRSSRSLVPINCAALPEPLLESEMFGHRKGSFTGADRDKPGLLEVANGSTLFLDELTEMSMPLQAKLLRVLQDGVVRRVGSEHHDAVVDVRFISATNRRPAEAVQQAKLRADLLYRLCVVPIKLPSLRSRPEDIPLLATHFLSYYWERHRRDRGRNGSVMPQFSDESLRFLQSLPWPGNVRELQNLIEHLVVLVDPGHVIQPNDLPLNDDARTTTVGESRLPDGIMSSAYHSAKEQIVSHFEKEYLSRLVVRAGDNMSRAARLASIDRTTLYRLMEKHGLRRDGFEESADA